MSDAGNVENTRELRRRVQAARAYAGLSLDEFARRVGIGRQTLVRIENGERDSLKRMELREMAATAELPVEFFTMDFARTEARLDERIRALEESVRELQAERGAPAPPGELGRRAEGSQPSDEPRPQAERPEEGARVPSVLGLLPSGNRRLVTAKALVRAKGVIDALAEQHGIGVVRP